MTELIDIRALIAEVKAALDHVHFETQSLTAAADRVRDAGTALEEVLRGLCDLRPDGDFSSLRDLLGAIEQLNVDDVVSGVDAAPQDLESLEQDLADEADEASA